MTPNPAPTPTDRTHERAVPVQATGLRKHVYLALAFVNVGLASLGVVLPGLPTTIFLILAVWFFARSRPEMADRVMSWRAFRPLKPFVLDRCPIPPGARNAALVVMWAAIAVSASWMGASATFPAFLPLAVIVLGLVGTLAIFRAGRRSRRAPVETTPRTDRP